MENEMGRAYIMHMILVEKPEGKKPLGRFIHMCKDNTKNGF
jgi:hypothetical protein